MEKVKLTAIQKTWGDSRVTVYISPDKKLYIEFAMCDENNQIWGCFPQLVRRSKNEILKDDYVALIDKKTPLRNTNIQLDLNDQPRIPTNWIHLHAIDTLRKRTKLQK